MKECKGSRRKIERNVWNAKPTQQRNAAAPVEGIVQLRILPATGAEQFAKFIYQKINTFIQEETEGRVRVIKVEFFENHKNSAIYKEN